MCEASSCFAISSFSELVLPLLFVPFPVVLFLFESSPLLLSVLSLFFLSLFPFVPFALVVLLFDLFVACTFLFPFSDLCSHQMKICLECNLGMIDGDEGNLKEKVYIVI